MCIELNIFYSDLKDNVYGPVYSQSKCMFLLEQECLLPEQLMQSSSFLKESIKCSKILKLPKKKDVWGTFPFTSTLQACRPEFPTPTKTGFKKNVSQGVKFDFLRETFFVHVKDRQCLCNAIVQVLSRSKLETVLAQTLGGRLNPEHHD